MNPLLYQVLFGISFVLCMLVIPLANDWRAPGKDRIGPLQWVQLVGMSFFYSVVLFGFLWAILGLMIWMNLIQGRTDRFIRVRNQHS